jgi:arabinogalactan oligomer/maltooligosaccharide transport system permease protein
VAQSFISEERVGFLKAIDKFMNAYPGVEVKEFPYGGMDKLPGIVPFQTWLVKSYFDQLPRSLDEAAFIDGANWFEIIFRVIFPASKAAFIIVLLFGFMGAWGEFFIAGIFNLKTLGWYLYVQLTGQAGLQDAGLYAAASIMYATPIIILFIVSQKYIGEAYRLGLKG